MALIMLIFIALVVNIVLLLRFLVERTLTSGVALLMVLLFCLSIGYKYLGNTDGLYFNPIVKEKALRTLKIELPSFEDYIKWFNPEKSGYYSFDEFSTDEHLNMSGYAKSDKISDEVYFTIDISCYPSLEEAKRAYDWIFELGRDPPYAKIKTVDQDYEYAVTYTEQYRENDIFWYYLPLVREFSTHFVIRCDKVVFEFWEQSNKRRSEIDKVIEELMTSYEKYLEENELS